MEIQTEKLRKQREALDEEIDYETIVKKSTSKKEEGSFNRRYKLINVVGVDNQLQATVQEISTGQNKRIAVGKDLDGYVVKSISLNDGIIFEKDGVEIWVDITNYSINATKVKDCVVTCVEFDGEDINEDTVIKFAKDIPNML